MHVIVHWWNKLSQDTNRIKTEHIISMCYFVDFMLIVHKTCYNMIIIIIICYYYYYLLLLLLLLFTIIIIYYYYYYYLLLLLLLRHIMLNIDVTYTSPFKFTVNEFDYNFFIALFIFYQFLCVYLET